MPRIQSPAELEDLRQDLLSKRDPERPCVSLCAGAALPCVRERATSLPPSRRNSQTQGLSGEVDVRKGPAATDSARGVRSSSSHPEEICYLQVDARDVPEIVAETLQGKKVVERLLYVDPATGEKVERESRHPLLQAPGADSSSAATEASIPRASTTTWPSAAIRRWRRPSSGMTPEQVLDEVKKSGLAGQGRRRLSRRAQVGRGAQRSGRDEVRDRQCRRGRPRRLHGPEPPGGEPSLHPRGADHRRLRHRRARGLHLRAAGVSAGGRERAPRHRAGRGVRSARQEHPRLGLRLHRQGAPGRRRLRLRRVDAP